MFESMFSLEPTFDILLAGAGAQAAWEIRHVEVKISISAPSAIFSSNENGF